MFYCHGASEFLGAGLSLQIYFGPGGCKLGYINAVSGEGI